MKAKSVSSFRDRRGERVMIIGDHPHSGKVGVYKGTEPTLVGVAALIELDDGGGCYVYHGNNLKFLSGADE
jgi:hypothetical protein